MTDQDHLDRINALTRNARSTWFALLAALVFVGITLMGVNHIDFYGVDRETELPLVSVAVPTKYFFAAAPILIAAIYVYFHLYLIRLWDALGASPARINGARLGDAVAPWLVIDASLTVRKWLRQDNSTSVRALEYPSAALNLMIAWCFGLIVLFFLWYLSLPARSFLMSGIAAASFLFSSVAAASSLEAMVKHLREPGQALKVSTFNRGIYSIFFALTALAATSATVIFTVGPTYSLASLDLGGENIVERPAGWLSYQDSRNEFRADWCRREFFSDADCKAVSLRKSNFSREFERRRINALSDMRRPVWSLRTDDPSKMDFRKATLKNSFLSGANLREAELERADLSGAHLEQADFKKAQMSGVRLEGAQLEGANLNKAEMVGPSPWGDQEGELALRVAMRCADHKGTKIQGANLFEAKLNDADLRHAKMNCADLRGAQLEDVNLSNAHMEGANLRRAKMFGTDLRNTDMKGVTFDFSHLAGFSRNIKKIKGLKLQMSTNNGGAVRHVNLSKAEFDERTDWRNVFLDKSVTVPPGFRSQMSNGDPAEPCQWQNKELSEEEFYGRWRGWVEIAPQELEKPEWEFIVPEEFENVLPIPPDDGCVWKTGPMPDAGK